MESTQRTRVLIVANRTASTPRLIEAVRRRAQAGPCEFALLIPDVSNRKAADWTLDTALRLLRPAAGRHVEGLVGGADPFESVKHAVDEGDFDEIIVSTLPATASGWLRRDLPERLENESGLPVEHVVVDLEREELQFRGTLVVANQTMAGDALIEHLKRRASGDVDQRYIVLVPQDSGDGQAYDRARARTEKLLESLHAENIPAVGMIGDPDPYTATMNAVDFFHLHDIVISTLPSNRSEWLKADLIERVKRDTGKPVEHVESTVDEPAPAGA